MKPIVLVCVLSVFIAIPKANAQTALSGLDNYLVILGAFSSKDNANRFSKEVRNRNLQPKIEVNKLSNLYYVTVLQTADHSIARAEADKLRESGPFKEAWVFTGNVQELTKSPVVMLPVTPPVVEEKPKEEVVEVKPPPIPFDRQWR